MQTLLLLSIMSLSIVLIYPSGKLILGIMPPVLLESIGVCMFFIYLAMLNFSALLVISISLLVFTFAVLKDPSVWVRQGFTTGNTYKQSLLFNSIAVGPGLTFFIIYKLFI